MALEYLLAEAKEARLSNDFSNAIRLIQALLDQSPENMEARCFLGLCLVETGDLAKGKVLIEQAISQSPDVPQFNLNASILREAEGNVREAVILASKAATLAPNSFQSWGHLGALLGRCGKFKEAIDALEKAHAIQPTHIGVAKLLTGAGLETGNLNIAKKAINAYSKYAPNAPDLPAMQCNYARAASDWKGLRIAAEAWLKLEPLNEEARVSLAFALGQTGYFKAAIDAYTPLVSMRKPSAMHLATMGRYYLGARNLPEAENFFNRAVNADGTCTEAHFGLSRLFTYLGKLQKAEEHCRKALTLDPSHAEAYGQLSEITGGNLSDADLGHIDELLAGNGLPPESRAILFFAKGDAWHKRNNPENAFEAWSTAGKIKNAQLESLGLRYEFVQHEEKITTLKKLFAGSAIVQKPTLTKNTPIFILGMPRSGTTLLENAIAAHPEVSGAGEIPTMPFLVDQTLEWATQTDRQDGTLPEDRLLAARDMYMRQAFELGALKEKPFFTDKQPANFQSPGLIQQLFPNAPMIHIRRSALETGFSIFRRNFTRQWPFANSLDDIAHYYAQYSELMEYWNAAYRDKIFFIQYEDFVSNFEKVLREVINFCGLEWNESCLKYYEQDRSVITFSATQVRKPPSKEHLNSTTQYREFLESFAHSLLEKNIHPATGAKIS